MSKPFVILPRELGQVPPPVGLVGQKARSLSQLLTLKARVPRFGVVTASAFDEFHQAAELRLAMVEARAGIKVDDESSLIAAGERLVREALAVPLPDAVLDGIAELKRSFADDDTFAVRASIVGEETEVRVLAGQLDAALGTRDVEGCVQRLFALAHHPRTLRTRVAAGLDPLGTRLAIVVQRLVPSEQSGVCLSFDLDERDGLARQPRALIRACPGLAGGIGGRDGNERIARDELAVLRPAIADDGLPDDARVQTQLAQKPDALRAEKDGRGTRMVPLEPEQTTAPSLSVVQARLVVKEALRLEAALGKPQVVGFAYAGRLLHILDVEPLLVAQRRVESTRVRVWDERLVPAPLQQTTSTLSFSVWQRGVARGMERAGRLFGVRGVVLEELRPQFRRALGTVTGRLTGNVDVIGALVDLLPFAEKARVALARASGQPELSARTDASVFHAQNSRKGPSLWERARQKIDESRWPGQLERCAAVADGEGKAFVDAVDAALQDARQLDVAAADPDALMDTFDALEEHLGRAIASLTLSGVVASLALVQLDEELAALGLSSLRPDLLVVDEDAGDRDDALSFVRRLHALVALIDRDPELQSVCRDGDVEALAVALRDDPSFGALREGLARFIDAAPPEGALLLEEQRLAERPHRLLQLLMRLWRSPRVDLAARHRDAVGRRKKAEYAVEQAIAALPGLQSTSARKRMAFAVQTTRHHADRFARSWVPAERVIAALRRIALGLGERLFEHALLEQPRDVFLLQDAELAGVIRGSGPDVDVRPLVLARRRAAATRPPATSRRTETRGVVATSLLADEEDDVVTSPGRSQSLVGVVAAAGEAGGPVCLADRVVVDDDGGCSGVLVVGAGSLLELPLLAGARAVVIERGTFLSPVSAALRQLAVPTIVQAASATAAFTEGEAVAVDATGGAVLRVGATAPAPSEATPSPPASSPPAVLPVGAFLRDAIATDPTGRPTRRAARPAETNSELPAPPGAGFFQPPPPTQGFFTMPPAIQVSDEGAPVEDADVVGEEPVR